MVGWGNVAWNNGVGDVAWNTVTGDGALYTVTGDGALYTSADDGAWTSGPTWEGAGGGVGSIRNSCGSGLYKRCEY